MKKNFVFCIMLIFTIVLTTACTNKQANKPNMIQSKRRFAEYVEPQQGGNSKAVDLSEGPKLNYDKKLGPQNPEFDIKIIDPY